MNQIFEIAIIGAGPGGIGAAANAASKDLSHLLFEKREIGNTIFDYQLKKLVMAEPRKLPLRAKVKFEEGSRENVLEHFNQAITSNKVNIHKAAVDSIKVIEPGLFLVTCGSEQFNARNIILAVGNMGTPRKLGAPGEDLPHIAYTLSDPDAFSGKHIVIVGAGDSAIENALALKSKNTVSIINRRSEFPRAKDANRRKILEAIKKSEINCFYDTGVKECTESEMILATPQGDVVIPCDHVIVRAGNIPPRAFIESCGVEFPSKDVTAYPRVNECYESNVKGLYIIGSLIGYPLIKQAINQGHEVVEHILGNEIEPADTPLIEEFLLPLKNVNNVAETEVHFGKLDGVQLVKSGVKFLRDRLSLFTDLSTPQFRELLIDSTTHVLEKDDIVFKKDDFGDSFWNVVSGRAGVISPFDPDVIYPITSGNFFGEMGLISGRRRAATVFAMESGTILLETKRNQILKLMGSAPSIKKAIESVFFLRILKTSVFPAAETKELSRLVLQSEQIQFNKGEVLFAEGDPGDALYIILKGSVKISKKSSDGVDVAQTYIAAGNYVGEMALVSGNVRSATASAAVRCETLKIPKELFDELLKTNPETEKEIKSLARKRLVENLTSSRDKSSGDVLDFVLQQGVSDANNVLLIDSDLCIGCDNCEKACAATHGGYSRLDRKKGKSFASIQVPISCRHCENPLCMLDCPPDALTRLPSGEVFIKETCIGCGNCVSNCPYDVIQLVYEKPKHAYELLSQPLSSLFPRLFKKAEKGPAKAAKCDMCAGLEGGPSCVRSCPTGAAIRTSPKEMMSLLLAKTGDS
ncbi:MAG TPA: NAD(P)-binding domain-containing protein [Oligoflexia bacterium]|nr:NAD(P)-binding domain-containing protein [Oligoflexia bacterium]HMP47528.1 NAD(P)-binding domain-containing protein [Oligoflexia bacterium]